MAVSACGDFHELALCSERRDRNRHRDLSCDRSAVSGEVLMTANGYLQLVLYVVVRLAIAKPLGTYMARIFEGQPAVLNTLCGPLERLLYRVCGINASKEMRWTQYALAMLAFNLLGALAVYGLQRLQNYLPLNPQGF